MKKAIKAKWLKALRSGKYTKGRGCLRRHRSGKKDTFCCLGVLCDLHAKETGKAWLIEPGSCAYGDARAYLPSNVQRWAGMKNDSGVLPEDFVTRNAVALHGTHSLAMFNDKRGVTFKDVAKIIAAAL
jgi:hypothetical protein